jgi:hypothetical protein
MQEAEAGECDVEVDADLVDIELVGTWLMTIHLDVVSPTTPKEGNLTKDRTIFCQYVGNRDAGLEYYY